MWHVLVCVCVVVVVVVVVVFFSTVRIFGDFGIVPPCSSLWDVSFPPCFHETQAKAV